MGKMADKDELRVLKMLKDNPASMLKEGEKALGRVAGVDFPKEAAESLTDASIKKRVLESMIPHPKMKYAMESGDDALAKGLANLLKKSGGKAAGILGGAVGLGLSGISEAADAPHAGEPVELENQMLEEARLKKAASEEIPEKNVDWSNPEVLKKRALQRAAKRMLSFDPEKEKAEMEADRARYQNISDEMSPSSEDLMEAERRRVEMMSPKERAERALKGGVDINRMLLEKGLLK